MTEICFDNNALQGICHHPNYEDHLQRIKELRARSKVQCHFNFINFAEQLVGVNEKYFSDVQRIFRRGYSISGGNILLRPVVHLRGMLHAPAYFNRLNMKQVRREGEWCIEIYRSLCQAACLADVIGVLEPLKNLFNEDRTEARKRSQKIKKGMENQSTLYPDERTRIDSMVQAFSNEIVRHQILNSQKDRSRMIAKSLLIALPSVRYYVEIYMEYYDRMFAGKSPKLGDYYDLEQIFYLDRCDYFITEDRALSSLINGSRNDELRGRAITLTDFLNACVHDEFPLPKRAPHDIAKTIGLGDFRDNTSETGENKPE